MSTPARSSGGPARHGLAGITQIKYLSTDYTDYTDYFPHQPDTVILAGHPDMVWRGLHGIHRLLFADHRRRGSHTRRVTT